MLPGWMLTIKKAKAEGVDLEEQIIKEAKWVYYWKMKALIKLPINYQ